MDCKEVTVHAKELCFVPAKFTTTDNDVVDCVEVGNLFRSCGFILIHPHPSQYCELCTVLRRCQPIFRCYSLPSSVVPSEPQKHHVYHGF